jgi:hypothetical protein
VSLRPVTIEQFPGLDLRSDPGDGRGAIDLTNVTITPGRVRTRNGTAAFSAPSGAVNFISSPQYSAAVDHLIAVTTTGNIYAYGVGGGLAATTSVGGSTVGGISGTSIGTTSGSFYYLTTAGVLYQWNGTVWSTPATPAAITPAVVTTSPTDNRLVLGSIGAISRIYFSDPGAPTTFGVNNWVGLTPGDGELITAGVVYNNQTFIFKNSKFFVFYGNSTDSTGNPVFNYRTVSTGRGPMMKYGGGGTGIPVAQAVTVGDDGVYFIGYNGIYRTTGGPPVLISQQLQPFFDGTTNSFWQGGAWNPDSSTRYLMWLNNNLYFLTDIGIFVYDRTLDTWSFWSGLGATALGSLPGTSLTTVTIPALIIGRSNSIVRSDASLTTDSGAAIVSRYRLPFETYGNPGEKRIRETLIEGTGTPTVQWSRDWGSLVTGSTVTLGTSPAVAVGRQRLAIRGRAFSLQFGASSGAWAVNRVQPNLGEGVRGVEATV